jgi:penicillin-binding protein 2
MAAALAGCSLTARGPAGPEASPTLPTPMTTTIVAPDPEPVARRFLEAWKQDDFAGMYALLSPLTQDSQSQEAFTATYKKIAQDAALTGIDYQIVASLVNPRQAQVSYRITLHSAVVGDVTRDTYLDFTRLNNEWRIAWTQASILPELAGGNQLYLDVVTPTRANIYDRNGLALATETEVVGLYIVPNLIGDQDAEATMLGLLSRMLHRRPESIQAQYEAFRNTDYLTPVGEVSLDDFQRYQDALASVGGVQFQQYSGRYYPFGGVAPQAVGYVAQIQKDQLDEYKQRGYRGDEFVGQIGLEYAYEQQLRGTPGGKLYLTDPNGQPIQVLATRDPQPPQSITTTLDRDLQINAQQAIAGFNGAIVVVQRDTGQVLAMVSSPSFDPNLFNASNPNSGVGLQEVFKLNQPFVDRATAGTYPLGSVFKIITMSAALQSGLYTADTQYTTDGYFRELQGWVGQDWTVDRGLPPAGTVTLVQGLERSCNPYFWHIGLDLFNRASQTALSDMAKAFGLGQSTGIEIGDQPGVVPDPTWMQQKDGRAWEAFDSVQLAIGQSDLQVTPLQVARFVAAVGNGGTLYKPQIVLRVQTGEGQATHEFTPETQGTLPVSPENLATIQQAMMGVVSDPRGTAYRRFLGLYLGGRPLKVAGKTGTAQSGQEEPHAWFAGYTYEGSQDKPDIAVVVLAEYQGEGSDWAAPIFRRVVESYYFGQPSSLYPWESQIGVTRTPTPSETPGGPQATETPVP